MSLQFPRPFIFLILAALGVASVSASCSGSETRSAVAPTAVGISAAAGSGGGRVTTAGDTPVAEPADEEDESPAPAPPPTDPGPWPAPPSTRPVVFNPTPDSHDYFRVSVNPNPVPFSGSPVPVSSCSALPHTWFYSTIIHSRTGNTFRVTERENYFDGHLASRTSAYIDLPSQQNTEVGSRWCSAYGKAHTAQHRFKVVGADGREVILNTPLIQLQQNPTWVPPPPAPAAAAQRLLQNPLLVWGD